MERGWKMGWKMGGREKNLPVVTLTRSMSVGDPQSDELWGVEVSAPSKASIHIPFNFTVNSYRAGTRIEL